MAKSPYKLDEGKSYKSTQSTTVHTVIGRCLGWTEPGKIYLTRLADFAIF